MDLETVGEQIMSAIALLSLTLILCTLIFSFSMYKASENVRIDVIYKMHDHTLKVKRK